MPGRVEGLPDLSIGFVSCGDTFTVVISDGKGGKYSQPSKELGARQAIQ